jgi:hypothetical protein
MCAAQGHVRFTPKATSNATHEAAIIKTVSVSGLFRRGVNV